MAIEAPIGKFRRNNYLIYIVVCLIAAGWLGYDGYFNEKFIEKHTTDEGKPDSSLTFNRKAPAFLLGAAVLFAACFLVVRNKKLVADENELIISAAERIPYDKIEKVDRTFFDSKGYFVITYKNEKGGETARTISRRKYDNLKPVLDHVAGKIS